MMVVEAELVMKHAGEEASFFLVENNEDGEEIQRSGMFLKFFSLVRMFTQEVLQ